MMLAGLQKLTLLDFPGHVACTVFTHGCNFRCPFCHNSLLVDHPPEDLMTEQEVLDFLAGRRGVLDGVAITGGEPLIHRDIGDFISRVRLISLVRDGMVDYVAMDIKNSASKYALTAGNGIALPQVERSIDYLLEGHVPYEFRTTAVAELHEADDFRQIGRRIRGTERYFIQCFKDSGHVLETGMSAPTRDQLDAFLAAAREYIPSAELRGV